MIDNEIHYCDRCGKLADDGSTIEIDNAPVELCGECAGDYHALVCQFLDYTED